MKKSQVCGISFFVLLIILLVNLVSGLRINEVEANPEGDDSGNEWIEFYSEGEVDFEDLKLIDSDNDEILLDLSFKGIFVFEFDKRWLDNKDNKLTLKDGSTILDETKIFNDNYNDGRSWQYCDDSWVFIDSTKRKENLCEQDEEPEDEEEDEDEEAEEETEEEDDEEEETTLPPEPEQIEEKIEQTQTIIRLNEPKTIKTQNIYKSKTQYIKEYAIYAFAVFCVLIIIILVIKNKSLHRALE